MSHIFLVRIISQAGERVHLVDKMGFSMGRSQEADLPVVSPSVSRIHLQVENRDGKVYLIDQGSANGTFVGGQQIHGGEPLLLESGQRVRMGSSEEEMLIECLPKPVELMNTEQQKRVILLSMSEILRIHEANQKIELDREMQRLRDSAQKELDQIKIKTNNEAQKYLEQAKIEAERIIMDARKETEKAHSAATSEVQMLRAEVERNRGEAERIILAARREAEQLQSQAQAEILNHKKQSESARLEAEQILAEGRREAERIQAQALSGVLDKRKQIEQEIFVLEQKVQSQVVSARMEAQKQADLLTAEAQQRIKKDYQEASQKIEILMKEAHDKSLETLRSADNKAEELIARAREEAKKVRSDNLNQIEADKAEAHRYSERMRSEASAQAKAMLEQAREKTEEVLASVKDQVELEVRRLTEEHRLDLQRKKETAQREIEETRNQMLQAARKDTIAEQQKIIEEFAPAVDSLKREKIELESSVAQASAQWEKHKEDRAVLDKQIQQLSAQQREEQQTLLALREQVAQAKDLINRADSAATRAEEAEEKRKKAVAEFETYSRKYSEGMAALDSELKEKKQKLLLEADQARKDQEEDIARQKLKGLEEVKKLIEKEERKYHETQKLRAIEIAQSLELKLVPKMTDMLKAGRGPEAASELLSQIHLAVEEVLLKEKSSVEAVTQHLGVDVKEEIAKNQRRKKILAWGAAAAACAVLVFHKQIREYLDGAHKLAVDQATEKRRAESIYTPIQDTQWRETYTDNVLFLRDYYEVKADPTYTDQWTIRLNDLDFLRSMGLNEEDMVKFMAREMNMIKRLGALRDSIDATKAEQGIEAMRKAEAEDSATLVEIAKGEGNFTRIRSLEKEFTSRYLRKRAGPRPASESPPDSP